MYYKKRKKRLTDLYNDLNRSFSSKRDLYCGFETIEEKEGYDLDAICSELLDFGIINKDLKTNLSVIIVMFFNELKISSSHKYEDDDCIDNENERLELIKDIFNSNTQQEDNSNINDNLIVNT